MLNFGAESALVSYFWTRILKKLLSYFNSAPLKLSNCKILQKKQKMPKFGTKDALFGYFLARIFL